MSGGAAPKAALVGARVLTWTHSQSTPGLRRCHFVVPGYDCGPNGEDCQHTPKGDHGRHCDDWHYIVGGRNAALALRVFAGNFPHKIERRPEGADLRLHLAFPVEPETIREGTEPSDCDYLEGGKCWLGDAACLRARDLFCVHGWHGGPAQSEEFWRALENEYARWTADLEAKRAAAPRQCPTCRGKGLVDADGKSVSA